MIVPVLANWIFNVNLENNEELTENIWADDTEIYWNSQFAWCFNYCAVA